MDGYLTIWPPFDYELMLNSTLNVSAKENKDQDKDVLVLVLISLCEVV